MTLAPPPTQGLTHNLPVDPERTLTLAERAARSMSLVNTTRLLTTDVDGLHQRVIGDHAELVADQLDQEAHALCRSGVIDLLDRLAGEGLRWTDVASIIGVSVPAVRKWRTGGTATGDNTLRAAALVALLDWLRTDQMIGDPAAWLEIPLDSGAPLTRLDLLRAGHRDLVIRSMVGDPLSPHEVLDEFEPGWREHYRSDIEVFTAADGHRSIRSKLRD